MNINFSLLFLPLRDLWVVGRREGWHSLRGSPWLSAELVQGSWRRVKRVVCIHTMESSALRTRRKEKSSPGVAGRGQEELIYRSLYPVCTTVSSAGTAFGVGFRHRSLHLSSDRRCKGGGSGARLGPPVSRELAQPPTCRHCSLALSSSFSKRQGRRLASRQG